MLEVVPHVELEKYLGKWYEIAHLPARFQEGCSDTTATYTLSKDGSISVLNECIRNGKVKKAKGKAKVVEKSSGAKLKVTFFRPFYGDYWIIKLGKDYDYAVVGTPNRKYLWILSRTPQMDDNLFSELIEFVKSKGFNVENFIRTSHSR
ncbi:MAG: lipocalin family protein [Candidatus Bathyarchaeia archaeon]|jgi:apolipoprotein D and lipocalin family protein